MVETARGVTSSGLGAGARPDTRIRQFICKRRSCILRGSNIPGDPDAQLLASSLRTA